MKSIKKEDAIRLRKALATAYHEREKAELGKLFQVRAMSQIRRMGPLKSKMGYFESFEQLVWRLAPVACALILILGGIFIHLNFISDYEVAKIFFEDPVDFSLF